MRIQFDILRKERERRQMERARTAAASGFAVFLRRRGVNPMAVIESVGLSESQLRDYDTFVDYAKFSELLLEGSRACSEPYFGLLLGQGQTLEALDDMPLIVADSPTLGDALQKANRFLYLHASGVFLDTHSRGERVDIELRIEIGNPDGFDQVMQLSVVHLAIFIASFLDIKIRDLPLMLRQAQPGPKLPTELGLQKLKWSAGFDGLSVPASWLELTNRQDESVRQRLLETHLRNLQSRYPNRLTDQIKDLIGRLLPSGECSLERIAQNFNLHPRSLQQALKEQGTSYRDLLRSVRRDFAIQRLNQPRVSITDLALQLGYAELAVFSRHFKSWTGLSPTAWHRAHRQQADIVTLMRQPR
jgi:AraC-like DNA-binding protein